MTPIPQHLQRFDWYAPHLAWMKAQGLAVHHDPGEAKPSRANLRNANLRNADLGGAYLGYANLRNANLGSAYLRNANLRGANLGSANLGSANLRNADLGSANLRNAYLGSANLRNADLGGANLRNANLRNADLGSADLSETILDPSRPVPPCTDQQLRAALLEPRTVKGRQRVYGYRTRTSQHVGSNEYKPRRFVYANALSLDPYSDCHPGIYFGGTKHGTPEGDKVQVWAYRDECFYVSAAKGVRARRVYVVGPVVLVGVAERVIEEP